MSVTGGPLVRGGGGMPQRIVTISMPAVGKGARHLLQVADVAVDDPEQRDDRGLVCGDAVEIAHGRSCVPAPLGVGYHS